jgi:2-polyprenyl-6-methoxyphenol hydroxylase-like FAD-dependent oxidoreductase
MSDHQVLIVGAGPTRLVLALWLTRQGIRPRIIDRATGPGTTSRAMAVQARTLELYRQLDLTEGVLAAGHRADAVNLWVEGERKARIDLGEIGLGLTPYPFVHIFPQDRHERLLVDKLASLGVQVERNTELLDYTDRGADIEARYRDPAGQEQRCRAQYLVGCDGAGSIVRKSLNASFEGGTYSQRFYVADIEGSGPVFDGGIHIDLNDADFLGVFGMGEHSARLVGIVREDRIEDIEALRFEDVSERALADLQIVVSKVNWFSTYKVHHRVAGQFRQGRAFIAGDAGHIHSPAGGQGMNTGIGDAINLAWKLAAVLGGRADETLLDTYEAERIVFARKLVQTTDRVFTLATADSRLANVVRTRLAPVLMPMATRIHAVREFMFRTVSQTVLSYREGPLGEGKAGEVHGGDRLPWAPADGQDNFDSLGDPVWQVHVYGDASQALADWCLAHLIPLCCVPWSPAHEEAGLMQDAAYLLRPDGYVGLADPTASVEKLARYLSGHGLRVAGNPAGDPSGRRPAP